MRRIIPRIFKYISLLVLSVVACTLLFLYVAAIDWIQPTGNKLQNVIVENVHVVDVVGGVIKEKQTVVIENGKFVSISPDGYIGAKDKFHVMDASRLFMTPGLWNMHAHLSNSEYARLYGPMMIANGVFYVREMSGDCVGPACKYMSSIYEMRELQKVISQSKILMPKIMWIGGFVVDGPRAGYARRGRPKSPKFLVPGTEEEGREIARYFSERGVDFIKPYDSLPRDAYFAMMDEAEKLGLEVGGHVPKSVSLLEAIQAGQRSVEHARQLPIACSDVAEVYQQEYSAWAGSNYPPSDDNPNVDDVNLPDWYERALNSFNAEKCDDILRQWALSDSYYVPTHLTRRAEAIVHKAPYLSDPRAKYVPDSMIERGWAAEQKRYSALFENDPELEQAYYDYFQMGVELTGRAHSAGVKIMAGTDSGDTLIYPGFSLHDELLLFVQAGLTPAEALRSATIVPARYLGVDDDLGSIDVGKTADFILLNSNPLDDLRSLGDIETVFYAEHLYSASILESLKNDIALLSSGVRHAVGIAWHRIHRYVATIGN